MALITRGSFDENIVLGSTVSWRLQHLAPVINGNVEATKATEFCRYKLNMIFQR